MTPSKTRVLDDVSLILSGLGYALLIFASPIAFSAMIVIVNEYRSFGIADDWFDCNSTSAALFLGVPTLAIYGAGAVINALHFRKRFKLIVAVVCTLICIPVALNVVEAIGEQTRPGFEEFCFGP